MQFELLGILTRRHVREPRGAVRNSNASECIARHREPHRYRGLRPKQKRGKLALGPPVGNSRSRRCPTEPVDFTRGRKLLGCIRGRQFRDELGEGAGHGTVRNCSVSAARREAVALSAFSKYASKTTRAASEGYAQTSLIDSG